MIFNRIRPTSPLAPFEHLETIADNSEIIGFHHLRENLTRVHIVPLTINFTIQTKDSSNAQRTVGGDKWTVTLRGIDDEASLTAKVTDKGFGKYDVSTVITRSGRYKIEIKLHKKMVSSLILNEITSVMKLPSPLILNLLPGPLAPDRCVVKFDGDQCTNHSNCVRVGIENYILVYTFDKFNNSTLLSKTENLRVTSESKSIHILSHYKYHSGIYRITFYTEVAQTTTFSVTVVNETGVIPILPTPLHVQVHSGTPNVEQCTIQHDEIWKRGEPFHVFVKVVDEYNNYIMNGDFEFEINRPEVKVLNVSEEVEESQHHYVIKMLSEYCGNVKVGIFLVGVRDTGKYPVAVQVGDFACTCERQTFHVKDCIQTALPIMAVAGESISVPITTKYSAGAKPILGSSDFHLQCLGFYRADASPPIKKSLQGYFTNGNCSDDAEEGQLTITKEGSHAKLGSKVAGTFLIELKIDGVLVEGNPISVVFHPQAASPDHSCIPCPVRSAWVGKPSKVLLLLKDMHNNIAELRAEQSIDCFFEDGTRMKVGKVPPVKYVTTGSYNVFYNPHNILGQDPNGPTEANFLLNNTDPDNYISVNLLVQEKEKLNPLLLHQSMSIHMRNQEIVNDPYTYLQFEFEFAQSFTKVTMKSRSHYESGTSLWIVEYSDNKADWHGVSSILQIDGWSCSEWRYKGSHKFWRLYCPNERGNEEVDISNPLSVRQCLTSGRPLPCDVMSIEWYCSAYGRLFAHFVQHTTAIHSFFAEIDKKRIQGCEKNSKGCLVWVNNVASHSNCKVEVLGNSKMIVQETTTVQIILKDSYGNQRLVGTLGEQHNITVNGTQPNGKHLVHMPVINNENGTYSCAIDTTCAGKYHVEVRLGSHVIPFQPFLLLSPGEIELSKCTAVDITHAQMNELRERMAVDLNFGLSVGVVGKLSVFAVVLKDKFGNVTPMSKDVAISIKLTHQTNRVVYGSVVESHSTYQEVHYKVENSGTYQIEVTGKVRSSQETVFFSGSVEMLPADICPDKCSFSLPSKWKKNYPAESNITLAGELNKIVFTLIDVFGNVIEPVSDSGNEIKIIHRKIEQKREDSGITVDPRYIYKPDEKSLSVSVSPQGHEYVVEVTSYTAGGYELSVVYESEEKELIVEVLKVRFTTVSSEVALKNLRVGSASEHLGMCMECSILTGAFFCSKCNQSFCGQCFKSFHECPARARHYESILGVDDVGRELGERLSFGVVLRDEFGNFLRNEPEKQDFNIFIFFREYVPDVKPKKDKSSVKKKVVHIPITVINLEGDSSHYEVLMSDSVQTLKLKIAEREPIPSNIMKLMNNGTEMENSRRLSECGILKGSEVQLALCDVGPEHQLPTVLRKTIFEGHVIGEFEVKGYGMYTVHVKRKEEPGDGIVLRSFIVSQPEEYSKGKAAQVSQLENMIKEVEDLRSRQQITETRTN